MIRYESPKLKKAGNSDLILRQALPEDVLDILRWRNDPYVCAMSKESEPINEAAHRNWYVQALKDPKRLLLIGLLKGKKVGIVRFDLQQSQLWKVSIMLSGEARGRGLGQVFLRTGLEQLYRTDIEASVLAEVKLTNIPSIRIFTALGFVRKNEAGTLIRFVLPASSGR